MVLKKILRMNDFSSGLVAVLTLLHHMMLLMVSFAKQVDYLYRILMPPFIFLPSSSSFIPLVWVNANFQLSKASQSSGSWELSVECGKHHVKRVLELNYITLDNVSL